MENVEVKKINYSWEKIEQDTEKLGEIILNSYNPEIVIVLGEGGWIPGRLMKNVIKDAKYYSIGCDNYDEDNNILDSVQFYQIPDIKSVENKKVLILDEVCETGGSLIAVKEKLLKFNPKELKTAVLHKKDRSNFEPDFITENVGNDWIIYPWKG